MKNFVIIVLLLAVAFFGGYFLVNEYLIPASDNTSYEESHVGPITSTPTTPSIEDTIGIPPTNRELPLPPVDDDTLTTTPKTTNDLVLDESIPSTPPSSPPLDLDDDIVIDTPADDLVDIPYLAEDEYASGDISGALIDIDSTWNKYSHPFLGFSIKVPKEVSTTKCKDNLEEINIPMIVLEDDDAAYITKAYSYNWMDCSESKHTLSDLQDSKRHAWKISPQTVNNDTEIDAYIKKHYGSGCSIKEKVASSQAGVFDIKLQNTGPGFPLEESCFINYRTVIKYSPDLNLIAHWSMGQDANWYKDNFTIIFDQEMADSFRFE